MNRANVKVVDMQNPTNLAQVGQMMNQMLDSMMPIQPSPAGDIASRLQQLDQLYHSNLISREEYETTRQKILDDLA
jgi:BMFP domain-containing protein YqiC